VSGIASVNPCVVKTYDGQIGIMTGRHGLYACIRIERFSVLQSYPLAGIAFLLPYTPRIH
jgi:hypothetical protein